MQEGARRGTGNPQPVIRRALQASGLGWLGVRPDLTRFLAATTISAFGDMALELVLPYYVYASTGSVAQAGGTFLAEIAPRLVLGVIGGTFADRWDRRRMLVALNLVLALVVLPLLLVTPSRIWVVVTVALVMSSLTYFKSPAEQAMVPGLVSRDQLLRANSLVQTIYALVALIGPAIGGAMLALGGLRTAVVVDSATFLLAAVFVASMRRGAASVKQEGPRATVRADIKEGIGTIFRAPALRGLVLFFILMPAGDRILSVIFVPYVKTVLGQGPLQYGWVLTAVAVGSIFGGIALARLGSRLQSRSLLVWSSLVAAALVAAMAPTRVFPYALLIVGAIGAVSAVANVALNALIQSNVEQRLMGRVSGALSSLSSIGALGGAAFATGLTDRIGVPAMILIAAVFFAVITALTLGLPGMSRRSDVVEQVGALSHS